MKIQPDLANGNDFGMRAEFFELTQRGLIGLSRIVRMETNACVHAAVFFGKRNSAPAVVEIGSRIDNRMNAGVVRAAYHIFSIIVELFGSDMSMRINKHEQGVKAWNVPQTK
jgi:hypothetical protein